MKIKFNDFLNENIITPPIIPNTMNFWHGGNLTEYNDIISHKNGRYEYGAGLYLTTHYGTASKYAKGKRKMYLITVEKGVDINYSTLDINNIKNFIDKYITGTKKKQLLTDLQKFIKDDQIKAYIFDNTIMNNKAIKASNTKYLRQFYIDNGIDYNVVGNAFGWGEKMLVLYNMDKIVNKIQIEPKDEIEIYDLPTDFKM